MFDTFKPQSGSIQLIHNIYSTMLKTHGINYDRDATVQKVASDLAKVYDSQDVELSAYIRPMTKEEEFIIIADYLLSVARGESTDSLEGLENFLEVENGAVIPLGKEITSALMQHFLWIITFEAIKAHGLGEGIPLFAYKDGCMMVALYMPKKTEGKKVFESAYDAAVVQFPRSKYDN